MDRTTETLQEPAITSKRPKSARVVPKKKMQRTRSFTDALREKYCSPDDCQSEFIIDIVVRGKPRNNGPTSAELAHLRNVVLSNSRVSTGGLPENGLPSLCPNVTDLDLSSNLLESWAELLPMLSQLPHLKFLNLSRNHITRHKEELWRWSTPLPKVENMVLNSTGVPLREVLALARLMPALRELHICCNYYGDLGSVEVAINDGALSKLECLRLNENIITSWTEVWKLRNLPCLTQLILSENPLCDVYYTTEGPSLEESMFEMDSPDITCHSDGEDTSFGSPHFKYPVMRMTQADDSFSDANDRATSRHTCETQSAPELSRVLHAAHTRQCHLIHNLIDDLITDVCRKVSVQESSEDCGENRAEDFHRVRSEDSFSVDVCCDNQEEEQEEEDGGVVTPVFYLEEVEASAAGVDERGEGCKEGEVKKEKEEKGKECSGNECEKTVAGGECAASEDKAAAAEEPESTVPFAQLHTLCLSRTSICDTEHLQALNEFPALHSLRIMDIALFSQLHQEDRRKLYVASLPSVKVLNGSEVTVTERDKAERYYLRHFLETEDKTARYLDLESKHGPIQPLFDIDLGARFQTQASLTVVLCGVEQFTETISLLQPVGKLRKYVADRLAIPRSSFRMFHLACGPHQDPMDRAFDELFLDSLPLSRFDFLDGDELHVDFLTDESTQPELSGIRF